MTNENKIQKIVGTIVQESQPEKIILFGSWAWGQPNEESDLDLLVVQDSGQPRLQREREIRKLLYPFGIPMDVLVFTPEELEKSINEDRNLFLEDIVRNGRILFERPGFNIPLFHRPAEILG